jgi:monofunctional biosynthetic peptidoglycan transglycosylase
MVVPLLIIVVYRFAAPPVTPLILIRSVEGYHVEREWLTLKMIAPAMRRAVIASEDQRFCDEKLGIDFGSLNHQRSIWLAGGHVAGASTITMQTARNLFLWTGRSLIRKPIELWLTPQIALVWPKWRVLEVYLNVVEFGPGIFGVQAAAKHYFGTNATHLDVFEAARLAEVLPNPLHRTPNNLDAGTLMRAVRKALTTFSGGPDFSCSDH